MTRSTLSASAAALVLLWASRALAAEVSAELTQEAVSADDECLAGEEGSDCALNALQLRASKRQAELLEKEAAKDEASVDGIWHYAQDCWHSCGGAGYCNWCGPGNACCRHGRSSDPAECHTVGFWPTTFYHTCTTPRHQAPSPAPGAPGGIAIPIVGAECKDQSDSCAKMAEKGECTANPNYMQRSCRVSCKLCTPGEGGNSKPVPHYPRIEKPPAKALDYDGISWPAMEIPGTQEMHILAIGDWGGMDGGVICQPRDKKPYYRIIQYHGGDKEGSHTMARSRPGCKSMNLVECFNTQGQLGGDWEHPCVPACGWQQGVDDFAQYLVADQFNKKASEVDPQFVLNVGDNFYWGGIETDCGTPMGEISKITKHQFDTIFEGIYHGPGLDGKPWLSVLGNHDWGGRYFNAGWDQQIAYTWASDRWIMPAPYWHQYVKFTDLDFSVDIYMIDTNFEDAKNPEEDSEHNICGALHTPEKASCSSQDGPPSIEECVPWFQNYWKKQTKWLEEKIAQSTADWRIIVTHFPCGHEAGWYAHLHQKYNLDLLVTGHRHDQELWSHAGSLGGLTCIVTGGGGGITSEHSPLHSESQYGFFDLTISKTELKVQLINHVGKYLNHATVKPKKAR